MGLELKCHFSTKNETLQVKLSFNASTTKMSFISKYVEAVNFNEMSAEAEDRDLKSKLLNETNNLQVKQEVKVSSVSIQNDEDKKRIFELKKIVFKLFKDR